MPDIVCLTNSRQLLRVHLPSNLPYILLYQTVERILETHYHKTSDENSTPRSGPFTSRQQEYSGKKSSFYYPATTHHLDQGSQSRRSYSLEANQQLTGANQQLTGANQQLTARNQQMTGANQQLTGGNQQMTGANQQLTEESTFVQEIKKQQQQQLKELQQQIYIQQQQQLKLKEIQKLRQERRRSDQTAAILPMQRQRKFGVVQNNLVPCTTVQEHEDVNFLMVENPWKQSPGGEEGLDSGVFSEIYESEGNMEEDENKDEKIRMEKDGQIEEMERVLRKEGEKEEEEEKRSLRSLLFRKMMLKKIVN